MKRRLQRKLVKIGIKDSLKLTEFLDSKIVIVGVLNPLHYFPWQGVRRSNLIGIADFKPMRFYQGVFLDIAKIQLNYGIPGFPKKYRRIPKKENSKTIYSSA